MRLPCSFPSLLFLNVDLRFRHFTHLFCFYRISHPLTFSNPLFSPSRSLLVLNFLFSNKQCKSHVRRVTKLCTIWENWSLCGSSNSRRDLSLNEGRRIEIVEIGSNACKSDSISVVYVSENSIVHNHFYRKQQWKTIQCISVVKKRKKEKITSN